MFMKNSQGAVLAIALCMMFIFGMLGLGALQDAGMQGQVSVKQAFLTQDFWLADAGVQDGLSQLESQVNVALSNVLSDPNLGASLMAAYLAKPPLQLLSKYNVLAFGMDGTLAVFPPSPPNPFVLVPQGTYNETVSVAQDPIPSTRGYPGVTSNNNPQLINGAYYFFYNYSTNKAFYK